MGKHGFELNIFFSFRKIVSNVFSDGKDSQKKSCNGRVVRRGGYGVGVAGWNLEWNLPGEICLNWAGWVG